MVVVLVIVGVAEWTCPSLGKSLVLLPLVLCTIYGVQ